MLLCYSMFLSLVPKAYLPTGLPESTGQAKQLRGCIWLRINSSFVNWGKLSKKKLQKILFSIFLLCFRLLSKNNGCAVDERLPFLRSKRNCMRPHYAPTCTKILTLHCVWPWIMYTCDIQTWHGDLVLPLGQSAWNQPFLVRRSLIFIVRIFVVVLKILLLQTDIAIISRNRNWSIREEKSWKKKYSGNWQKNL